MAATSKADAYRALQHAAEQVGATMFARQLKASRRSVRYIPTPIHQELCEMSSAVLCGDVAIDAAYAFITSYEVMRERFD